MKRSIVLTTTSLISIILLSLHLTDDIVYGADRSPASNVMAIAVLVIWLYGTLVLAERRSGYTIMLLGSVAGMVVFTVHISRVGGLPAGALAQSSGAFFFVWTLLALAVTSIFSAILSAYGLWNLRRSTASNANPTSSSLESSERLRVHRCDRRRSVPVPGIPTKPSVLLCPST
jgi:hypothetical protein